MSICGISIATRLGEYRPITVMSVLRYGCNGLTELGRCGRRPVASAATIKLWATKCMPYVRRRINIILLAQRKGNNYMQFKFKPGDLVLAFSMHDRPGSMIKAQVIDHPLLESMRRFKSAHYLIDCETGVSAAPGWGSIRRAWEWQLSPRFFEEDEQTMDECPMKIDVDIASRQSTATRSRTPDSR